jgi:hypothetical protein
LIINISNHYLKYLIFDFCKKFFTFSRVLNFHEFKK